MKVKIYDLLYTFSKPNQALIRGRKSLSSYKLVIIQVDHHIFIQQ